MAEWQYNKQVIIPRGAEDLFSQPNPADEGCIADYFTGVFSGAESTNLFAALMSETNWSQSYITMFGKSIPIPRLTAWYGNPGAGYTYSGIQMKPLPWTPALEVMRKRVEELCGVQFNSVLLNLYRNGNDKVAWHSDDEQELGLAPVIASVSLGAVRRFRLRSKPHAKGNESIAIDVEPGSCLVMAGLTQAKWEHELSRTAKDVAPRINLTFRAIFP
jgi:alkylated DNA repair dioxygenase AlkB